MWVWIAIGVGCFLVLSLLAGFALALILAAIAQETTELYESDVWSTLPPARMSEDVTQRGHEEQSLVDRQKA